MQLNYKKIGEGFPVIILHGLLGSLDNWQTIAKKMAEVSLTTHHSPLTIYIVDQRNHGRSPHSDEFNYHLLADDLLGFMNEHGIDKAHLIGHSMGGKTVMQFALQHWGKVEKLIVVDSVPSAFDERHSHVFEALFAADVEHATSREQVLDVLRKKLDDETTVQFLMKGLNRDESGKNFKWKFNAEALWKNYEHISEAIEGAKPFVGETLFIKGEKSDYIGPSTFAHANVLFPNNKLSEIKDAGHWVHVDKPEEFVREVAKFLGFS